MTLRAPARVPVRRIPGMRTTNVRRTAMRNTFLRNTILRCAPLMPRPLVSRTMTRSVVAEYPKFPDYKLIHKIPFHAKLGKITYGRKKIFARGKSFFTFALLLRK